MSTPSTVPAIPPVPPYRLPYAQADRDDLIAAFARIREFENFLLWRFTAYAASREVHDSARPHGPAITLPSGCAIDKNVLREPGGWTHWHVDQSWLHAPNTHHVTVYRYMDNDRGPGSRDREVEIPWAWVFGDMERDEFSRAICEALRAQSEGAAPATTEAPQPSPEPTAAEDAATDTPVDLWAEPACG